MHRSFNFDNWICPHCNTNAGIVEEFQATNIDRIYAVIHEWTNPNGPANLPEELYLDRETIDVVDEISKGFFCRACGMLVADNEPELLQLLIRMLGIFEEVQQDVDPINKAVVV